MKLNSLKCSFGVASEIFLSFIVNLRGIEVNREKIKVLRDIEASKTVKKV